MYRPFMSPSISLGLILLTAGLLLRLFLAYVSDRTVVIYFLRTYGRRLDYHKVLTVYFWVSTALIAFGLITVLAGLFWGV